MVTIKLANGAEFKVDANVFRRILSSSSSALASLKYKEKMFFPKIDQRAIDAVLDIRHLDPNMI